MLCTTHQYTFEIVAEDFINDALADKAASRVADSLIEMDRATVTALHQALCVSGEAGAALCTDALRLVQANEHAALRIHPVRYSARVRKLRRMLGMNQENFGALVGLGGKNRDRTVRAWELDEYQPSGPLLRVFQALEDGWRPRL
jgi:DNA-binding transcriptional regulator YiaG